MIVCHCARVCDRTIRAAIREGACTEEAVADACLAGSMCGGCVNMGLGAKRVTREEFDAALEASVVGQGNLFATREPMTKNRDAFPRFSRVYRGMIIGSFELISRPDLVLREVQHRARNSFALLRSMVNLSHAESAEALAEALDGRIQALARATALLSRPENPKQGGKPDMEEGN